MGDALRIALVAAEAAPLAKSGGLGDVAAALGRYLAEAGHDVRLFLPFYGEIEGQGREIHPVDFARDVPVPLAGGELRFTLHTTRLPGTELWIYLVGCPELYGRPRIYTSDPDEPVRFAMLQRAALESCQRMGWSPQIVHANDWHAALLPIYLRHVYGWDHLFAGSRVVLTIHNLAHQGEFSSAVLGEIGLAEHAGLFPRDGLAEGRINFLETGLAHADLLTTVSPTYAREIQTPELGMGLDGILRARADRLVGILNGVDTDEWDPARDPHIPHPYTAADLAGKRRTKRALLRELALDPDPGPPLAGVVSRLAVQKGFDLMFGALPAVLAASDLRLAVLGSGEERYERFFGELQRRFPGRVCFYRGFSEKLAHWIEAGADLFLMPSLFEPCGLNQMYSQRYGTVPIVRRTGGLADSVEPFDAAAGTGTGFVFEPYTPDALRRALEQALAVYRDRRAWRGLMTRGMALDVSWTAQIERYVELYRRLLAG